MLHRIEVDVVDVAGQVGLIADGVFPVAALPNPLFPPRDLTGAAMRIGSDPARKSALDQVPAQRKVRVALRQRPYGVEVIRQYADRNRLERITVLN